MVQTKVENSAIQLSRAANIRRVWGDLIFNVKETSYGAKGDGATTDTVAIVKAITDAAVDGGTVVFPPSSGDYVTSDFTVPSNVTLWFMNGAKLSINSGATVTINGPVDAGLYQIFSGLGMVSGILRNPTLYPQWWGAKGDGVTDDAVSIQSAINAAYDAGGGVVYFPSGNYLIKSQIVLKAGVSLVGQAGLGETSKASSIWVDNTVNSAIVLETGTQVVELTFFYPKQTNTSVGIDVPYVYPSLFSLQTGGVTTIQIRSCNFINVYYIADFTAAHGLISVKDCMGYAMYRGFVIDNCTNIDTFENIHFNPALWSSTFSPSDRSQWTRANGYCFHVKRADWIKIINCFGWGYSKGIYVENGTSGSIASAEFDKCGFDMCLTPIHINATNAWGISITNCSLVAQDPINTAIQHTAIQVDNWAYMLTITNNKIWSTTGNGIIVSTVAGSPYQLIIEGNQILSYGVANSGSTVYAIFIQNILGAIVSNNHINGNSRDIARGIIANSCPDLIMKNNILRNMAEYGIILGENGGQPIQDFYIVTENIYRGSGVALLDNGTGTRKTVSGNLS